MKSSPDNRTPHRQRNSRLKIAGAFTLLIVVIALLLLIRGKKPPPVEKPITPSPTVNTLIGGQQVTWTEQGMSWTVPAGWTKKPTAPDEVKYGGNEDVSLVASVSAMGSDFPAEITLQGFYQGAKVREQNGQVEEVKWLELDGVRGVQFRDSKTQAGDGLRSMQWFTVRKFGGNTQRVNLILTSSNVNFEKHQDDFYAILLSTKMAH
jgi:hypothetical protein